MAVTIEASSTTRRSEVVTLADADIHQVTGVSLATTSGRIDMWGLVNGGTFCGAPMYWHKGKAAAGGTASEGTILLEDAAGAFIDSNSATNTIKDFAGDLNTYFGAVDNLLYIQNKTGASVTICYDLVVITH